MAVFDCCRAPLTEQMRDGAGLAVKDDNLEKGDILMIFGCKPGASVFSDSTLTFELFENLRKFSDP